MKPVPVPPSLVRRATCAAALTLALAAAASGARAATDVTVAVPGPLDPKGMIGCTLFAGDAAGQAAFPMNSAAARSSRWLAADTGGVRCRFDDVPDGDYAVAVMLDMNGNRRVDTNFVGMPQEAWGVSNNARPTLRAPRFDEAVFRVRDGKPVELTIKVTR